MAASFFFYDLETSGFSAREARIMQFAGQRTDADLQPIGEPVNVFIKLTPDVLPDPDAVLLTGITPQQTLQEGLTEAEFLKYFYETVVQPSTIFVGFNSVRFDDEFMRYLHYRNFQDAYEWQWRDGCSRWDILDLVRMTRALRPDGIEWPFTETGQPTNRLELLTKVNKLDHAHAHDALNDVIATIAVARLVRSTQPDLFNYLLQNRHKKAVAELIDKGEPFVYSTGRYPSETWHTSVAVRLVKHPQQDAGIVYDLRHDPTPYLAMTVDELVALWQYNPDRTAPRLPVKTLKYNRCPAVAPLGVIKDRASQDRLQLDLTTVAKHAMILSQQRAEFADRILQAQGQLDAVRAAQQGVIETTPSNVDTQLYDGFFAAGDKEAMRAVREADPATLSEIGSQLHDGRLQALLPLYKARNYPQSLSSEERAAWDIFCAEKLFNGERDSRLAKYFGRLDELKQETTGRADRAYLLEELQLYGESIMPGDVAG
ncbi:MAG: exodeoxyribonuclease I [Candidatus Saccharibacteria bacterium]